MAGLGRAPWRVLKLHLPSPWGISSVSALSFECSSSELGAGPPWGAALKASCSGWLSAGPLALGLGAAAQEWPEFLEGSLQRRSKASQMGKASA